MLVAIATLLLSWVCAARPARAEDTQQEARTSFEQGVAASRAAHWDEARAQFERSLSLVPKASTMFNLAIAYIKLGRGKEALEQLDAFERAAQPEEHAQMRERAQVLRPQAQALVSSAQSTAQSGGNELSKNEYGLNDEARREVAAARELYAQGRDKQALERFEKAYARSKRPELLYNIGVVADRLRDDPRAIDAYDAFVTALPDAREAAVAQVRSEALRMGLERERSEPRAAPASTPASAPKLGAPRALIAVGGIVTVASLSATVVLAQKLGDYKKCLDAEDATSGRRCTNPSDVRGDQPMVRAGVAVTAIAAAAGVTMLTVGAVKLRHRKRHLEHLSLVPSFSLGYDPGVSLVAAGRF